MRLAGHTYAFRDRSLEVALDHLVQLGLDSVEIWFGHATEAPERTRELLAERDLEAIAVSAGGFYEVGDSDTAHAFSFARAIGAPVIAACVSPLVLPTIPSVAETVLCIENHWDQALATPREVAGAVAPYPGVMACLDTGHGILAGVRPEDFALGLGARLGHVHLKDARLPTAVERCLGRRLRRRLLGRPPPTFPGQGALDIFRLRAALDRAGYKGAVTLEYEGSEVAAALAELLRRWRLADSRIPTGGGNRAN